MIATAISKLPAIILKNTINALSACLSVLTSLVGLIFIVSFMLVSLFQRPRRGHRLRRCQA